MNLAGTISVYCGGPGSGRHKEYGAMKYVALTHGYRLEQKNSDGWTYEHPDGHTVRIKDTPDGASWDHRMAGSGEHERGNDAGSLSDHLGWVHDLPVQQGPLKEGRVIGLPG